ncbi:unnamed protein product [Pelagomonas calceolata]|uniref:U-box domain-containing protein n=1 Tax=Pelagomonas calceolata TaxID=35677 RepID=A0A8J2WE48_9STRA|nr:unnamed protein product [Pelagomonas calceolata]
MGTLDAAETPPEMRWWARIEDECPITLEPINTMTTAPFFLDGSYFDADSLHGYLIDTGRLENPCTRAPLSRAVCRALDEHVGDGSRRVEALHAQESAGADREAAVVTNALLDYYSRNRSSGGMRVVDDDEAPFVHAEADAAEEAFPSLVDRPPPPPRTVQNEGFADLARQRGEEDAVAAARRSAAAAVAADRRRAAREAEKGARRIAAEAARREAVAARTEAEAQRRRDDERKRRDALAEARAWAAAKKRSDAAADAARDAARAEARREASAAADAVDAAAARLAALGADRDAADAAIQAALAAERRREKKARERQRAKEKKKRQAAEKALAAKAQKKAEAAERHAEAVRAAAVRCPECDTGLPGKMTDYFEMCGIYYCSTACVKAARLANV